MTQRFGAQPRRADGIRLVQGSLAALVKSRAAERKHERQHESQQPDHSGGDQADALRIAGAPERVVPLSQPITNLARGGLGSKEEEPECDQAPSSQLPKNVHGVPPPVNAFFGTIHEVGHGSVLG